MFGDLRNDRARVALALAAIALILVHGFAPKHFLVDYTSLGLLAFILIVLLLPRIKRLNIFGQELTLDEKIDEVAEEAAELKDAAPPPTEEPLAAEEEPASVEAGADVDAVTELAQVDPRASLSGARSQVSGRLLDLFQTLEPDATLPRNTKALIARLQARGYLNGQQAAVAQSVLALTEGGLRYEGLTPAQATDVARSALDLAESIRRTAPRVFENEVADELRADPSLRVERDVSSNPPIRRVADFLVTTETQRIVVDAAFVTRGLAKKAAHRVVAERAQLEHAFDVDRVLVVIPDGVELPARAVDELVALAPSARLLKLRELRQLTRARNSLVDI